MRVRRFILFVTLLLLAPIQVHAAKTEVSSCESAIFKAFAAGDSYSMYDAIEGLLLEHPGSPEAALYLPDPVKLADVYGSSRVENSLSRIAARLNEDNPAHAGLYELNILLEKEKLKIKYSGRASAEIVKKLCPVSKWSVSGPYHRYGPGDIDHPFLPEITQNETGDAAAWRKAHADPDSGELDFTDLFPQGKGAAYARTAIAPGRPVKVRVYSSSPFKLFINGRTALSNADGAARRSSRVVELRPEGGVDLMIKVYRKNGWKFRMIITDLNDVPIEIEAKSAKIAVGSCDFKESMDYPYQELIRRLHEKKTGAFFQLGKYFLGLNSREAEKYFNAGAGSESGPFCRYYLAETLFGLAGGNMRTAEYIEASRIIKELLDSHKDYIPARYHRLRMLRAIKARSETFKEAQSLLEKAPRFFPLRCFFSTLLMEKGYDKEFELDLADFVKTFPFSAYPKKSLADYYRFKDPAYSARLYREALEIEFDNISMEFLIKILNAMGRHAEIVELVDRFRKFGGYDSAKMDALIEMGDYDGARTLLLGKIARREDPLDYLQIGRISYLEGEVPSMYWGKMLSAAPELFLTGDLLDYLSGLGLEYPLSREREEKGEDYISRWIDEGKKGSGALAEVLFRQRIYTLNRDGSSRAFGEDVIYVHDRRGVERYGEFLLDHGAAAHPLRARVYREDGSYNDVGRVIRVNGAAYLSLPSLKERSIIHVAYFADNPFSPAGESGLFATRLFETHDFDEALGVFSCKVTAQEDMDLRVAFTGGAVTRERHDGLIGYSMRIENRPSLRAEEGMLNRKNYLPVYAFSTMSESRDFARWYNSLTSGMSDLRPDEIRKKFKCKNLRDAVRSVYSFVTREIDTQKNVLYYPQSAAATMIKKRGTPEDKALTARALLECLGIRSYPAFAAERGFPDLGGFVSPHSFTHILLYVPIDSRECVWMDFSKPHNGFGVVDPVLEGVDAHILVRDKMETKSVSSSRTSGIRIDMELFLDDGGSADFQGELCFYGRMEGFRSLFLNVEKREEMANNLLDELFTACSLDDFRIEGFDEVDRPFALQLRGKAFSLASLTQNRMVIRPVLKKSEVLRLAFERERKRPFYILSPINESERYIYKLPKAYLNSSIEKEETIKSRFGYVWIRASKTAGKAELEVRKEVHVGPIRMEPVDYSEFIDFCERIQKAEQHYLIIGKAE